MVGEGPSSEFSINAVFLKSISNVFSEVEGYEDKKNGTDRRYCKDAFG